jgi:hypothetical protein
MSQLVSTFKASLEAFDNTDSMMASWANAMFPSQTIGNLDAPVLLDNGQPAEVTPEMQDASPAPTEPVLNGDGVVSEDELKAHEQKDIIDVGQLKQEIAGLKDLVSATLTARSARDGVSTESIDLQDIKFRNVSLEHIGKRLKLAVPLLHVQDGVVQTRDVDNFIQRVATAAGIGFEALRKHPEYYASGGFDVSFESLEKKLRDRLHKAGCQSTRVAVLLGKMSDDDAEKIVVRYEKLSKKVEGNDKQERVFDVICESWYLNDDDNDEDSVKQLKKDLSRIEKEVA